MESYQVIIAGAGTAGCVLAARLSEDPTRRVLLLEAGPDYPNLAALPSELASSYRPAFSHDWDYHSVPDARGRSIHLPRARVVGGCSATNATFALRGAPADYDAWAALGNSDWSYAEVLPWFRRLEHDLDFGGEWHGREGPVPIRRYRPEELTRVQRAFLEACSAAGLPLVEDHNAPRAMGAGSMPMNAIAGVRQSAAQTHLAEARGRPNLTVLPGALVDRVVFQGRRGVGVRLAAPEQTVYAETVILAAGSYGSPAVLLRSGVGPAEDLVGLGLPIVEDLPGVGRNLADHPLIGLGYASDTPAPADPAPSFQTALTLKSTDGDSGPDLQIFPMSAFPSGEKDGPAGAEFILFVSLVKPRSRGRLNLSSVDPAAPPRIDLGYFAHPDDLPRLLEGVRIARSLARTAPLAELAARELFLDPGVSDSVAAREAAVRVATESYHHPVGTCHMGPVGERESVVDGRGKVHGLEGLYVVDASIMPTIPSANTNMPTLMLAERCAAWLAE